MDDAMHRDYSTLISEVGEATAGLGTLLLEYASPSAALSAPEERLAELPAATQKALRGLRDLWSTRTADPITASAELSQVQRWAQRLVITESAYPAALRAIPDPPPWLFVEGDTSCLSLPAVAIVGSRRASRAGREMARRIATQLVRRGYLVCSGLALGIDAAAHEGALEAGPTAAVLASGLDRASPYANLGLARRICATGCLLSELPRGTSPNRARFPRRNRIISGLCQATIVVEAALPSGSLHTATAAAEQGRDVFVLPWSLLHAGGRGCLRLLRDGAVPITDLEELTEYFPTVGEQPGVKCDPHSIQGSNAGGRALESEDQWILDVLGDSCLSAEELQALLPLEAAQLSQRLTVLEVSGTISRDGGGFVRAVPPIGGSGKP